jgi:hypothetical protein
VLFGQLAPTAPIQRRDASSTSSRAPARRRINAVAKVPPQYRQEPVGDGGAWSRHVEPS